MLKVFSDDKEKKVTIRVHSDCRIIVTAPNDANSYAIHDAVMKRAKLIWDGLKEFRAHQEYVQPKHYVSGEMQFYLDRRYVLKVVEEKNAVV